MSMLVSIITINLNNKIGLELTIQSVISQNEKKYEFIIIDGDSDDGSKDIINKYSDYIDFFISEKDSGIYNAMNKGIKYAHGEYINFLNSGDIYVSSSTLQSIYPYLNSSIVFGHYSNLNIGLYNDVSMMDLFRGTISHQATFYKRELFDKYQYDENYKIVSDWKLFIEMIIFDNVPYRYVDLGLVFFNPDGVSSTNAELCYRERLQVLKSFFPDKVIKDYVKYCDVESPILYLLPYINKTYRCHKIIYFILHKVVGLCKLDKKPCNKWISYLKGNIK